MLALLGASSLAFAAGERTPTQEGIVYGVADGVQLTMDYYAPKGPGVHPIAIIIHGGGYQRGDSKSGSEAYCADFLAPAGYAVFSINYRLAPRYPYPYMVYDVERSVRYLRHNAAQWHADPARIALVGGSAGGFLSNMAGLRGGAGDARAQDPVDRESAKVQAVVTLFAQSSFATVPLNADVHALLDPLIRQKGEAAALREASPITYVSADAPPFLQILGDQGRIHSLHRGDQPRCRATPLGSVQPGDSHSQRNAWHRRLAQAARRARLGATHGGVAERHAAPRGPGRRRHSQARAGCKVGSTVLYYKTGGAGFSLQRASARPASIYLTTAD